MMNPSLKIIRLACAIMLCLAGSVAHSQTYPVKTIRAIVPFAAGGAADIMARDISQKLTEQLGQQVFVDNRGGAGGIIAAVMAKDAPPDGYTIFFGTISTLSTNVATRAKLPYDPLRDFAPITMTSSNPYFLVIHPSVPANSTREFVDLARSRPGKLNFASSGLGGGAHLAIELLRSMAKIDMVHVPYKGGSGQSIIELIGGQVEMTLAQPTVVLPHAKNKRLKILGVTGLKPLNAWPSARPVAETIPGYESTSWQGLVVPANTPKPIIDRLYTEVVKALRSPDLTAKLLAEGSVIGGMPPEAFATHIRSETAKWTKVFKDANIPLE
jgi:tripartite-type tricarboxylate transporter receptor subunit TctC